ncbi:MAG: 2-isopropylmalate synthase [Spirochaetales bacterium]|nr:2-isopropylmalate synthase [Spirochaetales bacterium]
MEKIFLFDTTLRDGEQSPGASMSLDQKITIAKQLEKMGIDVIEAGFPVSSPYQFETCATVSKTIKDATVCVLSRAVENDILKASEAVASAARPRIHTFIATSPIHMEYKLKKDPETVIDMAVAAVKYARNLVPEVEFSAEDATRSDWEFLYRIVEKAINAGATIINIPDTVGYTTPDEYGRLIKAIRDNVPNIDKAILSAHCHNDLGLAVANTLSGINNGIRQAEITINGIGERAGNAALEEIVMALNVRKDFYDFYTDIDTTQLYKASRLLANTIAFPIPRNKPIVGENVFLHQSGIHQDGVIKNKKTYEIMTPESVGRVSNTFTFGRQSGRNAFLQRLKDMNIEIPSDKKDIIYSRFLEIADAKKEVYDEDIFSIVNDELGTKTVFFKLDYFNIISGDVVEPTATVRIDKTGKILKEAATGDGPIDAIFNAIDKITEIETNLIEYNVQAVTPGREALGEVSVGIEIGGEYFAGRGSSTDILEASAKAYVNALNRYMIKTQID